MKELQKTIELISSGSLKIDEGRLELNKLNPPERNTNFDTSILSWDQQTKQHFVDRLSDILVQLVVLVDDLQQAIEIEENRIISMTDASNDKIN